VVGSTTNVSANIVFPIDHTLFVNTVIGIKKVST
jgi:hypothetical protein